MIRIKLNCPSCKVEQEFEVDNLDTNIMENCPSCGTSYHISLQIKPVILTASMVASMAINKILNNTTAIGAFLKETGSSNALATIIGIDKWERASRAVDKLEKFAEELRGITKPVR
jgi:hypothetical protein